MFLDEKVRNEVSVMKYVARHTNIPVPKVIGYGMAEENPTGLGPFIIMTWVEGKKMPDILRRKDSSSKENILYPDLGEDILKTAYERMADVLLELWNLDFDSIGGLSMDEVTEASWTVSKRQLTLDMNELIRACGLEDCVPDRTYTSSTDYTHVSYRLQWKNLRQQRNSVYSPADCRQKYTCRHLMQAIAPHFISRRNNNDNYGPFKLFGGDFCPSNVLVDDDLNITAVIDWEFCYAAPAQLAGSLPWWLLLRHPSDMLSDVGERGFLELYTPKAELFIQAVREREAEADLDVSDRLSTRMRESLETRAAWFNFACRMVIDVDLICWHLLDTYCWGLGSLAERVCGCVCGVEMHKGLEGFVRYKVRQLDEYRAELGEGERVEYEEETCVEVPKVRLNQLLPGLLTDQTGGNLDVRPCTSNSSRLLPFVSAVTVISLVTVAATVSRRRL